MPIYAYRCDRCGVEKDVLQKLSDAPLTVCPECGAEAFHKTLTAPAFQLKGSGWYVTDFRDNGKKAPGAEGGQAKGAEGGNDGGGKDAGAAKNGGGTGKDGEGSGKGAAAGATPAAAPAPAAAAPAPAPAAGSGGQGA
ncbi:MAG: FmdB family zinc ribbon protein [Burkholderiaceae bacterium]